MRLCLLVALLPLTGCVGGAALRAKSASLQQTLDSIHKPAYKCAPRDLALARSHLEFARLELSQGALLRAEAHVDVAVAATQRAELVAARPECQENADRDGDGILDAVDLCPDAPEDFDNYEDQDGCPEDQDTDGDGIPDSRDRCPNDKEDFDGDDDEDGCPDLAKDRDGDGIADDVDQCPDNPEDKDGFDDNGHLPPDTDGCPEPDNDKDGILDGPDKCPLQPEDKDGFEDADGCPDPDNDQDRIADVNDKCPNQPEDYDGDADDDGCPDVYKSIVIRDDRIELKQTVHFATGKARILSKSFPLLNEVALAMGDNATIKVRIEGHTDSRGSARYNLGLSKQRAASVRRYMVARGVDPGRMQSEGYGEDRPIEDNRTSDGRAANRRVEFVITDR